MFKHMRLPVFSTLTALLLTSGHAVSALPSHCTSGEFSIVDAWMGDIEHTEGGWRNSKKGKFLSLCADRQTEPFTAVTYRYGEVGHVEFEAVATANAKFGIANIATSPHTGDDLVFFTKGDYTYYVAIATGQGSGVSLYVYKGSTNIASHFSGNEENEDFRLGPAEIDFSSKPPRSSVLISKKPRHQGF
jgi:hypothetical protein